MATIRLRPLDEQAVVIVGGSSGIGLVTAKRAARLGASVAIIARNERALRTAVEEISALGGRAIYVAADASDSAALESAAEKIVDDLGRIDTWVNAAAVAAYTRLCESSLDEMRRQMDITFWSQVHGSRIAVGHMQQRGGALINVGSGLSDRAIPLLGTYCAAKHAVKAYTDALRMELEERHTPISVTLIKPSCINTPFYQKALTRLGVEPKPIPPVYAPEPVADAILAAAVDPVREVSVGAGAALISAARFVPWITDVVMERLLFNAQKSRKPADEERPHNLYAPLSDDGGERGRNWEGPTFESSAYTSVMLHRPAFALGFGLAAAASALTIRRLRRGQSF